MNIIHNKARNRAGIEMLKFLNKHGVKTLASINNIKPGQNLMKTLKEEGVNSIFVCGDNTIHEWKAGKTGKLKLTTREGGVEDIKKAFENQINNKGFSLIEVVSTCPTNWGLTPKDALKWLEDNMLPYYPLGVYKDRSSKEETK